MPSIKTLKNAAKKAAKKARANVSTRSSDPVNYSQSTNYYDVGNKGNKCSTFSDATDFAAYTMFKNFEWIPFMTSQGAQELIEHGTIGGSEPTKIKEPSSIISIYVRVLNVENETLYLEEGTYKSRIRSLLREFPWLLYLLRKVGDREYPGILVEDHLVTNTQELTENNFEIAKTYLPGFDRITEAYDERWAHVPRSWKTVRRMTWLDSRAQITVRPTPVRSWTFDEVLDYICEAMVHFSKVSELSLNTAWQQRPIRSMHPNLPERTEEQWHIAKMSAVNAEKVNKIHDHETKIHQSAVDYIASHLKSASLVMNKITGAARDLIIKQLKAQDYHGAYKELNLHFIKKGISKIADCADRVQNMKMKKGSTLETYINDLRNGLVEWASVKKMREFVTSKGKLDDFVFNNEEMAAHGSDINDADFKDTYGCAPQIPEATRVDIILKGVAECERFSMVDHLFSTYDIEDKSLVEVIRVLGNIEASSGGQDKLTNEIKEVTNKRKRDDNNGDNSKANLTIKKFPPGSCSVHKLATNHNNEMCFEQGNPRKFSWAPCAYCLKLGYKSAPNHSSDRCRLDPSSKSYVTPITPVKTNVTVVEEPPLSAEMIQSMITTSNKSVVKQLIKELKSKNAKPSKKDSDSE